MALLLSGCGRATLITDDAVIMAGKAAALNAYVGRAGIVNLHRDVRDAEVGFYVSGQLIGRDTVDENGRAFVIFEDPPNEPLSFQTRTETGGRSLEGSGRLFYWRPDRVIIAVDVDYCIVQTDYVRLIFNNYIPASPPFPQAREVLWELSKDYQLLYLTARSRVMLNRTREWLDYYGFPPGPVVVSDRLHDMLHQLEWKRDVLKELHLLYPTLLISIGNRDVDIQSALPNHILALTVQSVENDTKGEPGSVFLEDWGAIGDFFRVNRETLVEPGRLDRAIHEGSEFRQPRDMTAANYDAPESAK